MRPSSATRMADDLRQRRTRLERFYREEVESFRATDRLSRDTASALKTVCHALFWACALMEFHKKNTAGYVAFRDSDPAAGVIAGVRYGRNRAIHQFPQLLQITEGAQFPIKLPAPFFEISWRLRSDLPPPDPGHDDLADEYERNLQGRPVRFTFDTLDQFFGRIEAFSNLIKR